MAGKGRANGEGTISKRRDGRWCARLTIQTVSGPKRKAIYGASKDEVRKKLTKAIAERDGGPAFDAENLTVSEYLDRWLEDHVRHSTKPRTYEVYDNFIRNHIGPHVGNVKLEKLTPANLQRMYAAELDRGYSTGTVAQAHSVIAQALKKAVAWRLINYNPADAATPPRVSREEMKPLAGHEVARLLAAARERRSPYLALYVLASTTGMREGEMLALRWQDVDLEEQSILIQRTVSYQEGATNPRYGTPKGGKTRTVPLGTDTLAALRAHRRWALEERASRGAGKLEGGDAVFYKPLNSMPAGPLLPQTLRREYRACLSAAGLEMRRLHDLRHTCATLMLSAGHNVKVVSETLGHESTRVTLDTYSHVMPGQSEDAVAAVEGLISEPK